MLSVSQLISFVWTPGQHLPAGTGGSENYTVGQVRELNRRGVAAQVVTIGLGSADGRDQFADIPFLSLATVDDLGQVGGTIVFVTAFPEAETIERPYQMLHVPPPRSLHDRQRVLAQTRGRELIATSAFAAGLWAAFLDVDVAAIHVVYPFAEPCFAEEPRRSSDPRAVRVLYAGRLSAEKGIYTFLAMLHSDRLTALQDSGVEVTFTVTAAGADKPDGAIIHGLLDGHPGLSLVPARTTPASMAALMADHDVVAMPSNSQYWHETFGIVSIEAQHVGCRVVASDDGGLPETDCGAITLVVPDDADALARGVCEAAALGPVPATTRDACSERYTVAQSVDALVAVLASPTRPTPEEVIRDLEAINRLPSAPHRSTPRVDARPVA